MKRGHLNTHYGRLCPVADEGFNSKEHSSALTILPNHLTLTIDIKCAC